MEDEKEVKAMPAGRGMKTITITIREDVVKAAREEAAKDNRRLSNFIEDTLIKRLDPYGSIFKPKDA